MVLCRPHREGHVEGWILCETPQKHQECFREAVGGFVTHLGQDVLVPILMHQEPNRQLRHLLGAEKIHNSAIVSGEIFTSRP